MTFWCLIAGDKNSQTCQKHFKWENLSNHVGIFHQYPSATSIIVCTKNYDDRPYFADMFFSVQNLPFSVIISFSQNLFDLNPFVVSHRWCYFFEDYPSDQTSNVFWIGFSSRLTLYNRRAQFKMIKKWLKVNKLEKVTCQLKIGDEYLCSLSSFCRFKLLSAGVSISTACQRNKNDSILTRFWLISPDEA